MSNKYLKHKSKYYSHLNELMSKLSIEIDEADEEESKQPEQKEKCQICKENTFKYICPKCKVLYCSINCYKKHNSECTEGFYQSNVIEELKATKVSEDESKKFRHSLKNFYNKLNENNQDILDTDSLTEEIENKKIFHYEELLDKMNNGTFDMEKDLTPQDWEDFKKFVNSGNCIEDKIGKLYKPFWLRDAITLDIIDLSYFSTLTEEETNTLKNLNINKYREYYTKEENEEEEEIEDEDNDTMYITLHKEEQIVNYVTINNSLILKWKEIKNLASLTKTVPSERNLYQIVDIVFTVIYISRLFNGDFDTNSEILEYIFQLCPLLYTNKDTLPFDITSSINYIVDKMKIIGGNNLKRTKNLLISDMLILLKGMKGFIFESFIRLYDIIHFCSLEQGIKKRIVQRCTLSKNKLIYFMSYLKSNVTNEMINQLIVDIQNYKKEQSI